MDKLKRWINNNPNLIAYGIIIAAVGIVAYAISLLILLSSTEHLTVTRKSYKTTGDIYHWTTVRQYSQYSVPICAWDVKSNKYCERRDSTGKCIKYNTEYDYSERSWKFFKTLASSEEFCTDCSSLRKPNYPTGDYWKVEEKNKYYLHGTWRGKYKRISVNYRDFRYTRIGSKYKFRRILGKLR